MSNNEDIVRVIRVYEFSGPRSLVEAQIAKSLKDGTHDRFQTPYRTGVTIKVATMGEFMEVVAKADKVRDEVKKEVENLSRSFTLPKSLYGYPVVVEGANPYTIRDHVKVPDDLNPNRVVTKLVEPMEFFDEAMRHVVMQNGIPKELIGEVDEPVTVDHDR